MVYSSSCSEGNPVYLDHPGISLSCQLHWSALGPPLPMHSHSHVYFMSALITPDTNRTPFFQSTLSSHGEKPPIPWKSPGTLETSTDLPSLWFWAEVFRGSSFRLQMWQEQHHTPLKKWRCKWMKFLVLTSILWYPWGHTGPDSCSHEELIYAAAVKELLSRLCCKCKLGS